MLLKKIIVRYDISSSNTITKHIHSTTRHSTIYRVLGVMRGIIVVTLMEGKLSNTLQIVMSMNASFLSFNHDWLIEGCSRE